MIRELSAGATYMLLPSGVYFPLDTPELNRLVEQLADGPRRSASSTGTRRQSEPFNVTLWEELLELGVVDEQTQAMAGERLEKLRCRAASHRGGATGHASCRVCATTSSRD